MRRNLQRQGLYWVIFLVVLTLALPGTSVGQKASKKKAATKEVTLDFSEVDLPVLVRLISELTGKNFVIDEKVRGKISIISPSKIPLDRVYEVFLSVLELKGLTVVESGLVYLIRPFAEVSLDREVYVYRLKNMKSEEIAKVLRGLVAKPAGRGKKKKNNSKGLQGQVQILTDKETNSLVITATKSDYAILTGVIEELDQRRRQVYVEAVVLELSADKFRELGTELGAAFGYTSGNDATVLGGFNSTVDVSGLGAIAGVDGLSIGAVNIVAALRALKSSSDVNVLSTPQILTTDKQKAEIVVAQNVPFPGAQSQSVGGNVQTTIERKDVGIILRLTPDVLDDNRVQLDVYQEISSVVATAVTAGAENLGPTTNKRSASTTVIVANGQTVVIGGLIKDNLIAVDRKIPLLGDIPLIGWLFHFKSNRIEKTNLMIFLTPHIVLNDEELEEIRARKMQGSVRFMEEHLSHLREEGEGALFSEMIDLPQ
ncbi:MAG: hypothetical protein GXO96_09840 [Nitrospirae bacterium]|nr:hypothetical protein [Candidatus Manganitrophaceae bacterium]